LKMNRNLTRIMSSFTLAALLLTCFPAEAYAWGGTTRWPGICPTHQHVLKAAYRLLQADPAHAASGFPALPEILAHEGVKWTSGFTLDLVGSSQYDIVGDGPDDETKTRYSDHYYNPLLDNGKGGGNAPNAAKDYYLKLVQAIAEPRSSGGVSAGQGAAWSAHFLADMFVPYHVVGMPGSRALELDRGGTYLMDDTITGPDYLYGRPGAPKTPGGGWGGGDNFTQSVRRYVAYHNDMGPNANRDWFDPWYLNGLGFWDVKFWYGSHIRWEVAANKAYEQSPYTGGQESDAPGWVNGTSAFDAACAAQGQRVVDYTDKAARVTHANLKEFWTSPAKGTYAAIEAVYTMWRSSISAMRPELKVVPQSGNEYQLKATVTNVADEDVQWVQMKVTVIGGQLQGEPLHEFSVIRAGAEVTHTWKVTAPSIEQLHAVLEVIGSYQVTPDLQYARAETVKPLHVSVTPETVKAGEKITLVVRVDPPARTELNVTDWGPLEKVPGSIATAGNGVFTSEVTVKSGTPDGWYIIEVEAPGSGLKGSARFHVGDQPLGSILECTEAEVTVSVKATWKRSDGAPAQSAFNMGSGGATPGYVRGSFSGTRFTATWNETSQPSAMSGLPPVHEWGELIVDFDAGFTSVTAFRLDTEWEALDTSRINPVRRSISISASDIALWDHRPTYYGGHEVFFRVEKDEVCTDHSLTIRSVAIERDGTVQEMAGFTCEPTAGVAIMRLVFRTPPPQA
jgi:hypothetical protein